MFDKLFSFLPRKKVDRRIVAAELATVKSLMTLWGFEVVDRPTPAVYIEDQPESKVGIVFAQYLYDKNEVSLHSDTTPLWKGALAHELTHSCQPLELLAPASGAFLAGDVDVYMNDTAERQARIIQLNRVMPFTPVKLYRRLGLKTAEMLMWAQFCFTVAPVLVAAAITGKKPQYR